MSEERCEDCERKLDLNSQYKVPAYICETILHSRRRGDPKPLTLSPPSKSWILCRDCCAEILLNVKPTYTPFDPTLLFQETK